MGRWRVILAGYGLLAAGVLAGMATLAPAYVDYEPSDLKWLQTRLSGVDGIVYAGVDYPQNQVIIGVRTLEAKERVQREMRRLRLSPAMVRLEPESGLLSEAAPLAGCVQDGVPLPDPGPVHLVLSQGTAGPGEALSFSIAGQEAEQMTRGVDSYLECWDGQGWSPRYILFTNVRGPARAVIFGPVAINSLGLPGLGPEPFRLPAELQPGWYRVRKEFSVSTGGRGDSKTAVAYLRIH